MELLEPHSSCISKYIYANLVACFQAHLMFTRAMVCRFLIEVGFVAIELPKILDMYDTLEVL